MARIVLVDYGASNLLSVRRAFRHIGIEPFIATTPEEIEGASHLVLPGVGAFGKAAAALRAAGLDMAIRDHVRAGRPFLGICLGMQLMFEESEEFGRHAGLALMAGRVVPVPVSGADGRPHKVPHVGWCSLKPSRTDGWRDTILDNMDRPAMYFVHSFMAVPATPSDQLAHVDYDGQTICAAVQRGNMIGFQSHPEKSGECGLRLLQRFVAV